MKILVVEDSDSNSFILDKLLHQNGYEVCLAGNGLEALEKVEAEPVDLILSDSLMPKMDGFELCRRIKTNPRTQHIPFIFYSAEYTTPDDEQLAIDVGANKYIVKGEDPVTFIRELEQALAQSGQRTAVAAAPPTEEQYLQKHAERLVWKLEQKIAVLEQTKEQLLASNRELQEMNTLLGKKVTECKRVEEALQQVHHDLEKRVQKRTLELSNTIDILQVEILEREMAQNRLNDSHHQYQELVDSLDGIIWEVDARDFRFTFVSKQCERVLGYSPERWLKELTWQDLIHPEDLHYVLTTCQQATEEKCNHSLEYRMIAADGHCVWMKDIATVIVRNDQPSKVRGVLLDITKFKQAEEALRQSEEQLRQSQKMEAIGQLAGGVAHDFNNLLTVITGHSDRLLKRLTPDNPLRQTIGEIQKAGKRAASLTRQLLAFSRRQVLQPQLLNLNTLVTNMNKMLQHLIGDDIEIVTLLAARPGMVKADPVQLEQVLLNLAVNARDAMPQGGRLTIETADVELDEAWARRHVEVQPGPHVLLVVSDTGCGMDEKTLSRIFEPFFTTKEVGKGTGLGLAMIHGIVKQSSGHIVVASEPGQGTTFKIYLLRVEAIDPAPEQRSSPESLSPAVENILLVEDNEAVRALVCETLQESGYTVVEVSGGDEALQLCERYKGPIHLLLTDVVMPRMSGRELADRLQSIYPGLKVLYMSGYTEDAIAHHGVLDPGIFFITKPFSPDDLVSTVNEVLNHP